MTFSGTRRWNTLQRFAGLACLVAGLTGAGIVFAAAGGSGLDHLIRPGSPVSFLSPVRPGAVMDQVIPGKTLRERTRVLAGPVLGDRDVFVYLEQSVVVAGPASPSADSPGYRVVEVRFHDDKPPTRRELEKRTFVQSPSTAVIDRDAKRGLLRFSYRSPDSPRTPTVVSFGYSPTQAQFEKGTEPDLKPGWRLQREGDGTLLWRSLHGSSGEEAVGSSQLFRSYRLARGSGQDGYKISAELSVSKGAWSHTITVQDVPVPLEESARVGLSEALALRDDAVGVDEKIEASAALIYIPFPIEAGSGKSTPTRQEVGVVVDVERIERIVLARVVEDLKLRLASLRNQPPEQIPVGDYVSLDADLTVLGELSAKLGLHGNISDGITLTRSAISGLVFRIPVVHNSRKGTLLYSPGHCRALLVPEGSRWTPAGLRPLQFPAPNDRLVFSMSLKNDDALILSKEELDVLTTSLAKNMDLPELPRCQVMLHPPAGTAHLTFVGVDTDVNVTGIGSLKIVGAAFGANGLLRLGLSIRESEANRLNALYFTQEGIPLVWDVAPILMGHGPKRENDPIRSDAAVRLQVAVPDGFDLVSDAKNEVDVTVLLSESFKSEMATDSIDVDIVYGDDTDRKRLTSVKLHKVTGEAVVRMPVRVSNGRLSPALYYSVDAGESWVLSEDGLYGIVFIDSK